MARRAALLALALAASACAPLAPKPDTRALRAQVEQAELAFARSMAERDASAFAALVADDAVFLNDDQPLRGKAAITTFWSKFFTAPTAPFAWKPDLVEVLDDGSLAQTTGPVWIGDGKPVARFISVWRREADGRWRVIFDQGWDLCPAAK